MININPLKFTNNSQRKKQILSKLSLGLNTNSINMKKTNKTQSKNNYTQWKQELNNQIQVKIEEGDQHLSKVNEFQLANQLAQNRVSQQKPSQNQLKNYQKPIQQFRKSPENQNKQLPQINPHQNYNSMNKTLLNTNKQRQSAHSLIPLPNQMLLDQILLINNQHLNRRASIENTNQSNQQQNKNSFRQPFTIQMQNQNQQIMNTQQLNDKVNQLVNFNNQFNHNQMVTKKIKTEININKFQIQEEKENYVKIDNVQKNQEDKDNDLSKLQNEINQSIQQHQSLTSTQQFQQQIQNEQEEFKAIQEEPQKFEQQIKEVQNKIEKVKDQIEIDEIKLHKEGTKAFDLQMEINYEKSIKKMQKTEDKRNLISTKKASNKKTKNKQTVKCFQQEEEQSNILNEIKIVEKEEQQENEEPSIDNFCKEFQSLLEKYNYKERSDREVFKARIEEIIKNVQLLTTQLHTEQEQQQHLVVRKKWDKLSDDHFYTQFYKKANLLPHTYNTRSQKMLKSLQPQL